MKYYRIVFTTGYELEFAGEYVRRVERPNWHYYKTDTGKVLHCRKDKILFVEQSETRDPQERT